MIPVTSTVVSVAVAFLIGVWWGWMLARPVERRDGTPLLDVDFDRLTRDDARLLGYDK
jgi:hypothetical protein